MRFPFLVEGELDHVLRENWNVRFGHADGYDRSVRENVWRRHQVFENRTVSGWKSDEDARRRILHFRDRYGFVNGGFALVDPYLFFHLKLPASELGRYQDRIRTNLRDGVWKEASSSDAQLALHIAGGPITSHLYTRGDLICQVTTYGQCRYDLENEVPVPSGYLFLDLKVHRIGAILPDDVTNRAWTALKVGIRAVLKPGTPIEMLPEEIQQYLPAQVELGCGPSIEANVPALNYLHKVYSITSSSKQFVMTSEEDGFLEFLADPEGKYREAAHIHCACLTAEPTEFYRRLRQFHDAGYLVGRILTNNFDGLPLSVGLEELPLRQFDANYVYPDIEFHPCAKSLLVVGAHADRRGAQASARKNGLRIIYADPGGYSHEGVFKPYPVESPQDGDILVPFSANEFMSRLAGSVFNAATVA